MGNFGKMPETVFITVPKYVALSTTGTTVSGAGSATHLPKIRPAPTGVTLVKSLGSMSPIKMESEDESAPRGKKRRLDHLSWEEKIQRKKLKNRVAAQTSRDRKKARMEEMEYEIKHLTDKTELLQNKCNSLQSINDTLLEKNRNLDLELENLRNELSALKEQQSRIEAKGGSNASKTVQTCVGCESILNGSAAGINISNGLGVNASKTEKEQNLRSPLEDSCPLPTLQDMLLIDDEFDAGKLEELAESLLADITADLETSNGAGNEAFAEIASGAERLLGPMVGSKTEFLESCENSSEQSESDCLINLETRIEPTELPESELQLNASGSEARMEEAASAALEAAPTTTIAEASNNILPFNSTTLDTVYGTYDAKTNSITIVMDDDSMAVNEVVEEIYCEGESPRSPNDIKFISPIASPSQVFLNVTDCSMDGSDHNDPYEEDDVNFYPIEKFLKPKSHLQSNVLSRSPALSIETALSDHGYESIMGSPSPLTIQDTFDTHSPDDFSWEHSFQELFPSLV